MTRAWPLLLALAVGVAEGKAPKPAPPAPVATPSTPTLTDAQRAAAFAAVDASADPGARADALLAVLDNPSLAPAHGEAWARLGVILDQAELDIAALHAWAQAVRLDPAAMGPTIALALDAAARVGDENAIGEALANATAPVPTDAETRSRIAEVAGRWHLRHDNLGPAVAMLAIADPNAKNWPEVRALQGIVAAQQGRPADAVTAFQDAIQTGQRAERDPRWLRAQQLNLARAYYATENYGMAIFFFAETPRDSHAWAEAQFERAWAHFRADDMNGALGLLMTLESPFFDDWYVPEADLLRAYAFFMMCKFAEAKTRIDAFDERYLPLRQALDKVAPGMDDAAYFADIQALKAGRPTQLPAAVVRTYTQDDRFDEAVRFVAEAEREAGLSTFSGKRVDGAAKGWIRAQQQARVHDEATRVRARVEKARAELTEMLQGIQITGVDITTLEADLYERAAATGTLNFGDPSARLKTLRREKKGYHVWPFEGEYWQDELGWYQVDARPDCPEKLATGENKR